MSLLQLNPLAWVHRTRSRLRLSVGLMTIIVSLAGCRSFQQLPANPSFLPHRLAAVNAAIENAIASNRCPGGVFWLERNGSVFKRPYGLQSVQPPESTTLETVYDAASLTKVLATTPALMKLMEKGTLDPEAPVARYLPDFAVNGKETITVRHLLTHSSGLRPSLSGGSWTGRTEALRRALAEIPTQPPGQKHVYSDINFILLGYLIETISGTPLDLFCQKEIFGPLGMTNTGYRPLSRLSLAQIAPTEKQPDGTFLRGTVHDPTAKKMGGIAGHAGLFTTAGDTALFCRMLLNEGKLGSVRLFQPTTVRQMTSVQSPEGLPKRGFGWDIDSPYAGPRGAIFPLGSYGHTGWTGTSLWIDPSSSTFVLFFSNRNHPTEAGSVIPLRRQLGTLAAEAVGLSPTSTQPSR